MLSKVHQVRVLPGKIPSQNRAAEAKHIDNLVCGHVKIDVVDIYFITGHARILPTETGVSLVSLALAALIPVVAAVVLVVVGHLVVIEIFVLKTILVVFAILVTLVFVEVVVAPWDEVLVALLLAT